MSQAGSFGNTGGGGSLPPNVAQAYILDNGTAIPAANALNVNGNSTSVSNDNGIITQANPDLSDNLEIVLTNRLIGTAISTNGSTETLISFDLGASPMSYRLTFDIIGRDFTTDDCVGYSLEGTIKTDGSSATLVAAPYTDNDEDPALLDAVIDLVASGNNAVLQVTGVAGFTINYKAVGSYVGV